MNVKSLLTLTEAAAARIKQIYITRNNPNVNLNNGIEFYKIKLRA